MATAGIFCSAHDLHELGDFAGSVEQGVIGVAMEVDEGFIGHIQGSPRLTVGGGEIPL